MSMLAHLSKDTFYKLKGQLWEEKLRSHYAHRFSLVLVNPSTLRKLGGGQIDCLYWDHHRQKMVLIEAKQQHFIGNKQLTRLKKAARLLHLWFQCEVELWLANPNEWSLMLRL